VLAKHSKHLAAVRKACRKHAVSLDELGPAVGNVSRQLEVELPKYDLVFATARGAIEAMAAGCAVILADARGCGGLVTPTNVESYREQNFGKGALRQPVTKQTISAQLNLYSPADAAAVTAFIRANNDLAQAVMEYEGVYTQAINDPCNPSAIVEAQEVSRLLARWLPGCNMLAPIAEPRLKGLLTSRHGFTNMLLRWRRRSLFGDEAS
jgi:hypothetical protein